LLIGGATTSRVHAAVKIAPQYNGTTVHVLDASRSVGVVSSLLSDEQNEAFSKNIREEYIKLAENHASRQAEKSVQTLTAARANKFFDPNYMPVKPAMIGTQTLRHIDLSTIRSYIDWTPFFQTWELAGKFPAILEDAVVGHEAKKLFNDANQLIDKLIKDDMFHANAVLGIFPAKPDGDNIIVYTDDTRSTVAETFCFLRQQRQMGNGIPNLCLTDYLSDNGDYLGMFAVTAGLGIEMLAKAYEERHDDYNSIMVKAIADRFAEALAEYLHLQVRKHYWAYAPDENCSIHDLIVEKYLGIRPAPGYPACPEHSEKEKLFKLIDATAQTGIELTSSYAMSPAASVSGFYFAHPKSKYFAVGNIGKDQLADYAQRKGISTEEAEKLLGPLLF
jgi:5-methyltetrahydrofolate--homocysteine methyltransferase